MGNYLNFVVFATGCTMDLLKDNGSEGQNVRTQAH